MNEVLSWGLFVASLLLIPPLFIGVIRKLKARMQNRIGAPVYQPILDLIKFINKGETVSEVTSWIFRSSALMNYANILLLAYFVPWISYKPESAGSDLFMVVYLFALARFFTVLAALDAGSAFGGFGASREVTLALLVEPAVVLCLASLGVAAETSNLTQIFSFANLAMSEQQSLWVLSGAGLFLASLVELSRMPADDPTTHLELTMVHEAMVLENSGRNLALVEYAHELKVCILLGLSGQCFLHAMPFIWRAGYWAQAGASIVVLLVMATLIAMIESVSVKLRWTKLPEFIAYSVAMSLFCMLVALGAKL
jgi:formate hydrogenlyase subunit 4